MARRIQAGAIKLRGVLQGEISIDADWKPAEGDRIRMVLELDCTGSGVERKPNGIRQRIAFARVGAVTTTPVQDKDARRAR
jgi:hypothetical protein